MAITTGAQFDHYEILALIGAGGMGEVYLACDAKATTKSGKLVRMA